jgi:carboxyl-terminal processing protease
MSEAIAQGQSGLFSVNREQFLGKILKEALEKYHYRKLEVNDDLSTKAFDKYIEKLDYSKQFLLQSDVDKIAKFKVQMDDQMLKGKYPVLDLSMDIMKKRIEQAESFRKKYFKKKFDFTKKEYSEVDPKKRKFAKTEKDLEEIWRKTFKQSTLARYVSIMEDQDSLKNPKKDKKDKKKKKLKSEKILTKAQMVTKAHDAIAKKYKRFFERELQDDRMDYLERFYNSISEIFDPHTTYLPPKRKEDFDIDMSGQLEGIGAVLQEDEGYIKVVKVVPGGAAWRQKELEVEDVILAVSEGKSEGESEMVDLVGMRVDDAVRYIRGKKGTIVKLTVKKADGSRKTIPITRDVVKIGESFAKSSVLQLKGLNMKVGYIHVPKFYREFGGGVNCTDDVRKELKRVKKQGIDAVILDLRNNGGGALEDAKQMSGLFIEKGPIVQIKNHNHEIDVLTDTDSTVEYSGPLIVMINRFSASASEILAGALQDYKRAVIVGGEMSHGKGTVQAVLNLDQGPFANILGHKFGALKVTIQKFYRINGDSTQYKGVTPDVILPDPFSYVENREQDLKYSLPWDKVQSKKYNTWKEFKYDIPKLISNSQKRVKKDKRMQKIKKNVAYLKKRKDDTKVTLNLKQWLKEEKENKKMIEKLKLDDVNKDLVVTNFEASLKSHETVRKGDEKQWAEDFKQRKEEWIESLQKDAGLEEAMKIIADIIEQTQDKVVYSKSK